MKLFDCKEVIFNNRTQGILESAEDVESIQHHKPMGEGDRHYCKVTLEDGTISYIYDIDEVVGKMVDEKALAEDLK